MSAFTKYNPGSLTAEGPAPCQRWYPTEQKNDLPEFKLRFLNHEACREVSPYNKHFWPALAELLSDRSRKIMDLPRAEHYRSSLESYRHMRVHITAKAWSIVKDDCCKSGDSLHLLLKNACVTHVHNQTGTAVAMPEAAVDHMHIWVSIRWMNRVCPNPSEPLVLEGMLYEYVSSSQTRNIGVLPVLLADNARRLDLDRDPLRSRTGTAAYPESAIGA